MSDRTPDQLAREVREVLYDESPECRGEYAPAQADTCPICRALAALAELHAQAEAAYERGYAAGCEDTDRIWMAKPAAAVPSPADQEEAHG